MLLELVFQETFIMRDEEKREQDEWHERMVEQFCWEISNALNMGNIWWMSLGWYWENWKKTWKQVFHEAKFVMEAVMKLMPDASFSQSVSIFFMVYWVCYQGLMCLILIEINIMWI